MKVSLIQVFIAVLCTGISLAHDGQAQELLNRKINLKMENRSVAEILMHIEKQTDVKFTYQTLLFSENQLVTVNYRNDKLSQVLESLLAPLDVRYKIINRQIVLTKNSSAEPDETSAAPESDAMKPARQIVRGIVRDNLGDVLPGVSILIKGSQRGTVTDADGKFELDLADGESLLIFSYVGYVSQEVLVGSQTQLEVTLGADTKTLDEMVVIAYGTQRKATLTGAVASINTREIKQSPAANLAVTLAGRLPGLFAQQTSGEPGRDATLLFMRGRGTLNGSAPIILVDGVERELTSIDPNEVETISILKDASSTALFGVRGANGVILVTTKRGVETSPTISLSIERGVQDFTRRPSRVDSYEWAQLKNQAWRNDFPNPGANDFPPYSEYALERYRLQDYPEVYPNNNWVDKLMKKRVPQTRYNLNINGKGANVGYFVNVGYLQQSGQWNIDPSVTEYDPSQYMKRYNFRSNIDATLDRKKTLKTFLNASGFLEQVNGPFVDARYNNSTATGEIINRILNSFPSIIPGPTTPDGQVLVGGGNYGESPWAYINRSGYRKESRSNVTASWGLEKDFSSWTEGLSGKFMLSFDTRSVHSLNAQKQFQYWVQLIDPNTQTPDGRDSVYYQRNRTDFDNTPLNTSISTTFQSFYNLQLQANYNRTFNQRHTVSGLVLAQRQSMIRPGDALPYNLQGLAARVTYSFENKYTGEFNAGFNGSEQFAEGRRYGFFPSFSAGWNIHNEAFFKNFAPKITLLKLRGSFGTVGGDQLGNRRFLYLDEISRQGGSFSGTLGRGSGILESFFGNPNVQWEVARKANVGLELGFLKDFTLTADVFKERRENVLIFRGSIPMIIGVSPSSLAPANIGIIENQGYEIELNYNKTVSKDLSVIGKVNFNYAGNKVIFNDEVQLTDDFAYRYRTTGYQIGQQFGYKANGFFNSQEEINAYGATYQGRAPRPGDLKYEDLNGDGTINERDIMPIGQSSVPKYNWGAAANIIYKNFDLSILFQGAFAVTGQVMSSEVNDFRERHKSAWTPERAAAGEEILYPALSLSASSSTLANTYFNENKSFIRLKNIELGYALPESLTSKIGIRKMRLYVNGLNVFTWDKMVQKDWDPELGSLTSFPVYRVLNAGVNINF